MPSNVPTMEQLHDFDCLIMCRFIDQGICEVPNLKFHLFQKQHICIVIRLPILTIKMSWYLCHKRQLKKHAIK